jgi:hypothetical protein
MATSIIPIKESMILMMMVMTMEIIKVIARRKAKVVSDRDIP